MQQRAPAGGAYGANGDWYDGGKFINTVEKNAKGKPKKKQSTGKQEIEPYVWSVPPEGKTSLWSRYRALWIKTERGLEPVNDTALAYYGTNRHEMQQAINAFNAGERWIERTQT